MGKHETAYPRIERDFYPTPAWVVEALDEHVDLEGLRILEPACGDGRMAEALKAAGATVCATDIEDRGYRHLDGLVDFTVAMPPLNIFDGIIDGVITNPPLGFRGKLGVAFIETGLRRMNCGFLCGFMALLLPVDFDSAKTRRHLFGRNSMFAGKIIFTKRIKWFDMPDKKKSPKENHAWFLWGNNVPFRAPSAQTIRYAPGV